MGDYVKDVADSVREAMLKGPGLDAQGNPSQEPDLGEGISLVGRVKEAHGSYHFDVLVDTPGRPEGDFVRISFQYLKHQN